MDTQSEAPDYPVVLLFDHGHIDAQVCLASRIPAAFEAEVLETQRNAFPGSQIEAVLVINALEYLRSRVAAESDQIYFSFT